MICPECKGDDVSKDHTHADSLGVVCVCVACDATWIAGRDGNIELNTVCPGEARRAYQSQVERDDFTRAFNNSDDWGL